jgi:hypothetical protein
MPSIQMTTPHYTTCSLSLPLAALQLNCIIFRGISIHKRFVLNDQTEICNNFNWSSSPKSQGNVTKHRLKKSDVEYTPRYVERAFMLLHVAAR